LMINNRKIIMDTTIRELRYSDRIRLSAMIKKLTEKIGDDTMLKLVSSSPSRLANDESVENDENKERLIQIGIHLFKQLIEFLEDDVTEWFADLCGIDKEKFILDAPFDIEIIIINQLVEQGKLSSFLVGASKLFNTIKTSLSKLSNGKMK
jgi:hypothetical protein